MESNQIQEEILIVAKRLGDLGFTAAHMSVATGLSETVIQEEADKLATLRLLENFGNLYIYKEPQASVWRPPLDENWRRWASS